MAFLRSVAFDPLPILRGDGLYLRTPVMTDHPAWAELRDRSRGFLAPWEPIWPADDLDRTAFRRRLKRYGQEIRNDTGYPFFLFRAEDHQLLGGLTLSHVRRGVTQACSLGYWMGEPFAGRGHMSEAVRTVLGFAFATLRLHRVEAACLPHNAASLNLLEKVGFTREGYARRYLCINGSWQDHVLYAILAEDPVLRSARHPPRIA
ncbi:GNAT family N-acetyltransferase [Methyloraptor flagellatus]|jgi:ribosomal-protein-alanine N-acetyltransferase|uniref:GNAT family protein n=1 Tax=Methyloraptor flagellatus TaxID=3162530 RepID=A0AAU7X4U6_9HYPH